MRVGILALQGAFAEHHLGGDDAHDAPGGADTELSALDDADVAGYVPGLPQKIALRQCHFSHVGFPWVFLCLDGWVARGMLRRHERFVDGPGR